MTRYQKSSIELNKTIKRYYIMPDRAEYIWRCPRKACGAIVIKTDKPFLKEGVIYTCKRCLAVWKSEDLILHNKKNFKNYLEKIKKKKSLDKDIES